MDCSLCGVPFELEDGDDPTTLCAGCRIPMTPGQLVEFLAIVAGQGTDARHRAGLRGLQLVCCLAAAAGEPVALTPEGRRELQLLCEYLHQPLPPEVADGS